MNIYLVPPKHINNSLLLREYSDLGTLYSQITMKYDIGRFSGTSPLMRRFYRYQPFIFLFGKILEQELSYRNKQFNKLFNPTLLRFGKTVYPITFQHIEQSVSDVFDWWQFHPSEDAEDLPLYIENLSLLDVNTLYKELNFIISIYRNQYEKVTNFNS